MLFLPLLIACDFLSSPHPEPLFLSVPLPSATHARAVPARQLIVPMPTGDIGLQVVSDADRSALCDWAAGRSSDDQIAETFLAKGLLSFTILEASASGIRIGGQEVMALDGGRVPAAEQKGALIGKVYDRLLERAEVSKDYGARCTGTGFTGEIGLALAPDLPYETAAALIYSAGQAQYGTFFMLTDGPVGPPHTRPPKPAAESRQVQVALGGGQAAVRVGESEHTGPSASIPALVGEAASGQGAIGCGLITPDRQAPWQDVVASMDAISGQGATMLVLTARLGAAEEIAPIDASTSGTLAISLETTLPIIAATLPTLGPPRGEVGGGECDFSGVVPEPLRYPLPEGRLTDGELVSGDGLERVPIEEVLRRSQDRLRYCYRRELARNPDLQGTLTASFGISGDGSVSEAAVVSSTLPGELVAQCLVSQLARLQFPEPHNGVTVDVRKTYTFTP